MAKINMRFDVRIALNPEKGGGWLAAYVISQESDVIQADTTAWKNASAAKRWIKAKVQELTPRKSVKLVVTEQDENNKPTDFVGELTYKI